jgi:endonuclease-3
MTGSMMKMNRIEDYLEELYPNPKCELNYNKDYELLIAVVLSAQTTDKRVNKVTAVLFNKYDLNTLKDANLKDIEEILRPLGTFTKKAAYIKEIANRLVTEHCGVVPNDRAYLESLPGCGRKSTNVVLSNLYDVPAIAVDTHVERVSKRLGLANKNDTVLEVEKKLMKKFKKDTWSKRHNQLVLFGRYKCKAINPDCDSCKLKDICRHKKRID